MRNRLEQLRKRQRDEALQAQQELLATHSRSAKPSLDNDSLADTIAEPLSNIASDGTEEIEEYDRQMSPAPLEAKKLPYEDRQLPLIDAQDNLNELVSEEIGVGNRS